MPVGFLDEAEISIIRGDEGSLKKTNQIKEHTCNQCRQTRQCVNSNIQVFGNGKKKILFILDNPSEKEDIAGKPWRGEYGKRYRETMECDLGIDFERDCWTVYAVRCRGKVDALSVGACRKQLHDTIKKLDPVVLVPFGYWAMMGVSGDLLNNKSAGKNSGEWAGEVIPDQRWLKYIIPTWEPYWLGLLDRVPDSVYRKQTTDHLRKAVEIAVENKQVKKRNDEKRINIIYEEREVNELLASLISTEGADKVLALDYETTGRKPYRKGHKIYTAAISDGKRSWAFPFFQTECFLGLWKQLLRHRKIKWVCHNAKFEWLWTKVILGYFPRNIEADTMLGAKVLNNNKRVGLKPLVYCKYGIAGYDDDVEDYISTPAKEEDSYGSNGFNLIEQVPIGKILEYNAFDPLYTYWLYEDYKKEIPKKIQAGYKFLTDSSINLVQAEFNGMVIDIAGIEREKKRLSVSQEVLLKEIINEAYSNGWDRAKPFRPSAAVDISHLLFDLMGHKPQVFTKTGVSTDKNTLEKINEPIVNKILDWKKLDKLNSTYLDGTAREAVNGKINPFFNLHVAISYRSASASPNFQNFPKRDKIVSSAIRGLLKPHPGQKIVEYDYRGAEVCTSASYNKDPNLIKYIINPKNDMHRDTGEELYMYKPGELPKFDRGITKNKFVFPAFYGSYYEQMAKDLYTYCSKETKEHLIKKGIMNLSDFTDHVQRIENDFWDNRFPVYKQWKKNTYKLYLRKGFIDSYTGFRYYGPMRKNEVCNYPIQGSAFHCLLRTFNRLCWFIKKNKMQSKVIGQIHDSIVISVFPEEESYIDFIVWSEGTQKIVEDWKWIEVPLSMEKSYSEVDGDWAHTVDAGLLNAEVPIIKYE